jgi:hypothetical protein
MFCLLWLAFRSLVRLFRDRRDLILANIVLRQQLVVLKRRHPRPALHLFDKLFWVTVSPLWSQWKQSLIVVTPETVIRWHRAGFSHVLETDFPSPATDSGFTTCVTA